jgi:cyclophilin family peptidyl-prolyl cis-trans isomerase
MLDNSIIIAYSTPNYAPLTKIFLDSLDALGVEPKNIKHKLDIPNSVLLKKTGYQSDLWYYCVSEKINHLIAVLNNEITSQKYLIFSDCDIHFITKNKYYWTELENYIENLDPNHDIYFMRNNDLLQTELNSGFFIIKNVFNCIKFFTTVSEILKWAPHHEIPYGDQTVINHIRHQINYGYIPNDYVIFGTVIHNKEKALFHHAVMTNDVTDKIEQINLINRELQSQETSDPLTLSS